MTLHDCIQQLVTKHVGVEVPVRMRNVDFQLRMAAESSSASASSSSMLSLGEPLSEEEGKASFSERDVRVVREGAWSEEGEGEEGDVVMCAVWAAGKLGACYYCVASGVLQVMPDVAESVDFAVLGRCKSRT